MTCCNSIQATLCLPLLSLIELLTEPNTVEMAEWKTYYQNEDEEEEQEEGEQSGGEMKASSLGQMMQDCQLPSITLIQ